MEVKGEGKVTQIGLIFKNFFYSAKWKKETSIAFEQEQILQPTKLLFMQKTTKWHSQICTDIKNISQTSLLKKLIEYILAKNKSK